MLIPFPICCCSLPHSHNLLDDTSPIHYIYTTHMSHIYTYTYTHIIHILYTQHTYIIYVILVENGVSPKLSLIAWLRPPVNHHEPSGFQCLQWLLSELCCLRPALSWQLHLAAATGSPNVFFKTWMMFKAMLGVFVGQFWGCFWGCFGDVLGNMSTVLGANLWLALFFWDVGLQSILKRFPQHRRASCNLPKPTPKKYLFHTKVAKTHHSICCSIKNALIFPFSFHFLDSSASPAPSWSAVGHAAAGAPRPFPGAATDPNTCAVSAADNGNKNHSNNT